MLDSTLLSIWRVALVAAGLLASGPVASQAQAATPPDSLDRRLAAAPDSARLRLLMADASALRGTDPARAMQRAQAALQLARQQRRSPQTMEAQFLLGRLLNSQGNSKEAVRYLLDALQLATQHHDTLRLAHAHLYLGTAYKNLKQYPAALEAAQQARLFYQRASQAGNAMAARGVVVALNNTGTAYLEQKQFPAARQSFQQALHRGRALGDSGVLVLALYNLGAIALQTNQSAAAHRYYQQTLAIDQAEGNVQGQAESWLNLGDALAQLKRTAEAENAYRHALQLGRQAQVGPLLRVVYDGLSTLYENTNRPAEALHWRKQFQALNDSLYEAESAQQVIEMRTKYETEQQQARNQLQAAQLRTQQQQLQQRNVQLVAGLVVMGLLALVGWLLYTRQRLREQVAHEQERQQQERQRVAAVLEAEENERRRIGSDLHDGIGQLLATAKLNLEALDQRVGPSLNGQRELLHNAVAVVDESCREIRTISHNLMPNALMRQGLGAAVREFLNKLPENAGLRVEINTFGLTSRLDATTESVVFRVIQELVHNVIKHACANQLTVQLVQNERELTVLVEDNGRGFDAAALPANEGLGLRNVCSRLSFLSGRAHIDATPGHGTTVTLEVPLAARAASQSISSEFVPAL
ncbi:tetratricopeptide repeat-containing sensor histidine kinase [Hymenobacter guriensis]|uniref:Tetratricopeptide repeat protein n=1 Tax=Hymenobacter guriensis TaxID=2793065 RepID=A0ABS0L7F4_9BACT|nr:sensor histidine kinase [Hymenobacter guriensis]MBG8555870.1 tetratricopeptide repeat protein [Hymenobacter guriensis]